ncbi:hypothetical protein BUE80_DR003636 [Diplocarpon rosae]|nr:hypothetical protein BUE80_DR003636 [Diplocarpon rosae]
MTSSNNLILKAKVLLMLPNLFSTLARYITKMKLSIDILYIKLKKFYSLCDSYNIPEELYSKAFPYMFTRAADVFYCNIIVCKNLDFDSILQREIELKEAILTFPILINYFKETELIEEMGIVIIPLVAIAEVFVKDISPAATAEVFAEEEASAEETEP